MKILISRINIKKTLNLDTKISVNNTCHTRIISKENNPPVYHKLLRLLNLHASHKQKKLCFFFLNIITPTI